MDGYQILIIYTAVIVGAICQSSISMGFAMVSAPILLMLDPVFVPVPIILGGFLISVLVMFRERRSIDFSGISFAIVGRVLGALTAALVLSSISPEVFAIIFGGIILLAVIMSLIQTSWNPTPSTLFGAGLLSGLMGTLSSIGGPPMGLLYQHQQGSVIRGTLSGFFAAGTVISLTSLWLVGKFTPAEFFLFLSLVPGILVGFFLSKFAIQVLDKGYIRLAILSISALSGILVIIKTFMKFIS